MRAGEGARPERALRGPFRREAEARAIAVEHLRPGEQVPAERDGLGTLEVCVAGHQRLGLGFGDVEHRPGEGADRFDGLRARILDVEPHRRCDLVVPGAPSVDLPPDLAQTPLDRRMDVLVGVRDHGRIERSEDLVGFGEFVVGEDPGCVQASRVHTRRRAVVGQQLRVVRAEERPHLGREADLDPACPERHTATLRARAAASSASSEASRMKPSAASCGNVSPVAYEASVSA